MILETVKEDFYLLQVLLFFLLIKTMTVHTTPKSLSDVLHISNLSQKSQADRLVTTVSFFYHVEKVRHSV